MIRVTFDSNVWTMIADPSRFLKNPSLGSFQRINDAIRCRRILACLAETVFTLEAIQKTDRRDFLASYEPVIEFSAKPRIDGWIQIDMTIGPDRSYHPGNHPILGSLLQAALEQGFKLLRCPRIAGFVNPELPNSVYLLDDYVPIGLRQDRFAKCLIAIEQQGGGRAHIVAIGERCSSPGETWMQGIQNAPESENDNVAKAMAEWADGDSVAAHIAYENDYFCTRDFGVGGGPNSILSPANRTWLETEYDVKIVTPDELVAELESR